MNKILEYEYGDHDSEVLTLIHPGNLRKQASSYSDALQEFITSLDKRANKTYALVNAMSAGEHYGSNRNGDYFPIKALMDYHKTFESNGHVYKHHINKDPRKAMGRVVFAHYNPDMNRVELILELDDKKAELVIGRLGKGELPAVSMGCKVPFDMCSICGNRAKTLNQYCFHLKKEMNKVYDDGRRVYAVNTMPKFFDLSVVTIPADTTAGFLAKVASTQPRLSAELGLEIGKLGDLTTEGAIKKKVVVPTNVEFSKDPDNLVISSQGKLRDDIVKQLSKHSFDKILSTMLTLRMMPSRQDFQKLALNSAGYSELADKLDDLGAVFDADPKVSAIPEGVKMDNFNVRVASVLKDSVLDLSLSKPIVISRAIEKLAFPFGAEKKKLADKLDMEVLKALLEKYGLLPDPSQDKKDLEWNKQLKREPSQLRKMLFGFEEEPIFKPTKNPLGALAGLGALYTGYASLFSSPEVGGFKRIVAKHPWVMPLIVGAGTLGSLAMQDTYFKKTAGTFVPSLFVTVPLSYFLAGRVESDVRRNKAISKTKDFIRKHPFLTAVGMSGGLSSGVRLIKRAELLSQMDSDSINSLYNQLILN